MASVLSSYTPDNGGVSPCLNIGFLTGLFLYFDFYSISLVMWLDVLYIVTRKVVYTGAKRALSNAQNKYNDCAQLARVHLTPPLSHTLHCFLIVSAQEGRTVKCPFLQVFNHKSSASVQSV